MIKRHNGALLTTDEYVRRLMFENERYAALTAVFQKRIGELQKEYVRLHSKIKIGQVLDLPVGNEHGYTTFTVEHIVPIVSPGHNKNEYLVSLDCYGVFSGGDKEPMRAKLEIENDKNKTNEAPKA